MLMNLAFYAPILALAVALFALAVIRLHASIAPARAPRRPRDGAAR